MSTDPASGNPNHRHGEAQSELMRRVYALYVGMAATISLDVRTGLGGKLLFGGNVQAAREMLIAANIAGAASLAASNEPAAVRQAMRDGVVDFVVTSLEEALRILKNEIRKRQTVSVGVSVAPEKLTEQMLERGVLPDILPARESLAELGIDAAHADVFAKQGAQALRSPITSSGQFVGWSVNRDWMRWLPKLDACAKTVMSETDSARQRWLVLAPRYLGRPAQRWHGCTFSEDEFVDFERLVKELDQSGQTPVEFLIES